MKVRLFCVAALAALVTLAGCGGGGGGGSTNNGFKSVLFRVNADGTYTINPGQPGEKAETPINILTDVKLALIGPGNTKQPGTQMFQIAATKGGESTLNGELSWAHPELPWSSPDPTANDLLVKVTPSQGSAITVSVHRTVAQDRSIKAELIDNNGNGSDGAGDQNGLPALLKQMLLLKVSPGQSAVVANTVVYTCYSLATTIDKIGP